MKDLVGPTHMAGSGKTSLIEPSIVSYSTIISIGLDLDPLKSTGFVDQPPLLFYNSSVDLASKAPPKIHKKTIHQPLQTYNILSHVFGYFGIVSLF